MRNHRPSPSFAAPIDPAGYFLTVAAVALLAVPLQPVAASEVKAIETGGTGDLTMCPIGGLGCNLYHHINLPLQISTGDYVPVSFGSNPKQYDFPAAKMSFATAAAARCSANSQKLRM
jgi:hypothetical protein